MSNPSDLSDRIDWLTTPLEIKALDVEGRVIEGYAAVTGNVDQYRDVIEPGAFARTLAEKSPADIGVYIGHEAARLPVGICLELRADDLGLYTRTRILPTTEGNDLLVAARELLAAGRPLGMSIGYYPRQFRHDTLADGTVVRRLTDVDLVEYSFVGQPANPKARVVLVKRRPADGDADGDALETKETKAISDAEWAQIRRDLREMNMTDLVATHRRLHQWAARGTTLTGFTRADMEKLHRLAEEELRRRAEADGREPPEPSPLEWGTAKDGPAPEQDGQGSRSEDGDEEKHLPGTVQRIVQRERERERERGKAGIPPAAVKAGRVMSQKNLDRLHTILADLTAMHDGVCDMADACPMAGKAGKAPASRGKAVEGQATQTHVQGHDRVQAQIQDHTQTQAQVAQAARARLRLLAASVGLSWRDGDAGQEQEQEQEQGRE